MERVTSTSSCWGETSRCRDRIGSDVAQQELADLRKQISRTSKQETIREAQSPSSSGSASGTGDLKDDYPDVSDAVARPFDFADFLEPSSNRGNRNRGLGVVWKNLTVEGVAVGSKTAKTLPDALLGSLGLDVYHFIRSRFFASHGPSRELIKDFTGIVKPGEMLLVLGAPGSGCTTFLRAIANKRESYVRVNGDVHYGGVPAKEIHRKYRGEVVYNGEEDSHIPILTVAQTIRFALWNKTKKKQRENIPEIMDVLLRMFGISHTRNTNVGDNMRPGVSGGERKRVSIAETLATKYTVGAWDNSTRGLDSSTAVDYAKSLRVLSDITRRTTFLTLYQAGESIYNSMDKVLVIADGYCLFFGHKEDAKPYFENLGFYCLPRQTTADFLTALTNPTERHFQKGMEAQTPKTAVELAKAFQKSKNFQAILDEISEYEAGLRHNHLEAAKQFRKTVKEGKSRNVSKSSHYTVPFWRQIIACTRRQAWRTLADRTALYTKTFCTLCNGFIISMLFYNLPDTSAGAFARGGAVFLSILFNGWLQMAEIEVAFEGRPIVERHKEYALYRPSAVNIARIILDFPMIFYLATIFILPMYFLIGFQVEAGKFFIFYLFTFSATLCLTQFYRMFVAFSGHFDVAIRLSGMGLCVTGLFAGYLIPKPSMLAQIPWFGWLYYINPLSYVFEAVLSSEFTGLNLVCTPGQTVPYGPQYTNPQYQTCTLTGSAPGELTIPGAQYLAVNYEYYASNIWRNFGILVVFTLAYISMTMLGSEINKFARTEGSAIEFIWRRKGKKTRNPTKRDEENGDASRSDMIDSQSSSIEEKDLVKSKSIFTWNSVNYTVPTADGPKQLLHNVSGYTKPGSLTALMGASGAGKTTLLNTLAQRTKLGTVDGQILVDGRELGISFQRGTGFCEQQDIHDEKATVREALEFSALLRQEWSTPQAEKLAYVDRVIRLLELEELEDAIIESLGVEAKKRLTIGVELAAKPSLLLFLDEPTSGLDSTGAFSIVRFLRKLADAGQAILCTIHQPSAELIQQFDRVLALNPGGYTFYYGPIGTNGEDVINYFARYGAYCEKDRNLAEFLLETGRDSKFNQIWAESDACRALEQEVMQLRRSCSQKSVESTKEREFASPVWFQCKLLTIRVARNFYRDSAYGYGRVFLSVIGGLLAGFTFYKLGSSLLSLQDRLFSVFFLMFFPPAVVNAVVPKFFMARALWERRELPSRIYGWQAFCFSQIVNEFPYSVLFSVLYFLLWFPVSGISSDPNVGGYVYLMVLLFCVLMPGMGQWVTAFSSSFTLISNILPFMFVTTGLFNGIVVPHSMMNAFYGTFVYYLNPFQYYVSGQLAATLHEIPVVCLPDEASIFNPPPGQTCGAYASEFLQTAMGYISNPDATSQCSYCQYSVGDDYLATLGISYSDKWRDFGILLMFCLTNWLLTFFFIYTVRVKGFDFGIGRISSLLRPIFEKVKPRKASSENA